MPSSEAAPTTSGNHIASQATPTTATTATESIWGAKRAHENNGESAKKKHYVRIIIVTNVWLNLDLKLEQWPDITGGGESVWKTAASTQPTKASLAATIATAQIAKPNVATSNEPTMEQLRQEQARRMAMAAASAAEEERKAKELEEKQKQQQREREMEERRRKQEEERERER